MYKESAILWDGHWGGGNGYDTGRLTPEARREWRDRTDLTIGYLARARQGVAEMKALEREAARLGNAAMYPDGKLEGVYEDLGLKIAMLERERNKRYVDDK